MLSNSFEYNGVTYDYDTRYSCEESGCDDDGICRCGRIENARVTSVNIHDIVNSIYSQLVDTNSKAGKRNQKLDDFFYGGSEVDKYCIDRILRHYKIWDLGLWDVNSSGGYYGDEIDGVQLSTIVFNQISKDCYDLLQLDTLSDKLKLVLTLEYGYLLDDLKDVDFELIEINKNEIDFKKLNQKHINRVKSENIDYYKSFNYILPRGIVKRSGSLYTIVDGFHRIISSDLFKFKVFCIK